MNHSAAQQLKLNMKVCPVCGEILILNVLCLRTACTSLPVLVAHCEDFFHFVIHGFGKLAELLTFLFPVKAREGKKSHDC